MSIKRPSRSPLSPQSRARQSSLGMVGTRQWASDTLIRPLQSPSKQRVFVSTAGPCGSWLYRSLTTTGPGGWGVAPSLIPTKIGARVKTDRRDAIHVARLRRAGALTPVEVPAVHDAALRDLRRAREETLHDLQTAQGRLKALLLRQDSRSTGRATWGPAHLRWLREIVWPTPAPRLPRLCPGGHRPHGPAPAPGPGTPCAGPHLAALPGGGRVARPPWRAVDG